VALGHDVTLFATADSLTSARLHAVGTAWSPVTGFPTNASR
jgi:hypothetical protein